ncbi:MAG: dihydropteroate synthase, partial [Acidobacteria bacterium]
MPTRKKFTLRVPGGQIALGERTLIMGVLNITPHSFSDGGKFFSVNRAMERALQMEGEGADIIDIGAESTRPGSRGISASIELARLLPVLEALEGKLKIPISVDTQKSAVAEIAIGAGAAIINDVSGLRHDTRLAEVVAKRRVPIILMHMRGTPLTMQKAPFAENVVKDVLNGLKKSISLARQAGIAGDKIVVDPGIGFGKSYEQNYELLVRLPMIAK